MPDEIKHLWRALRAGDWDAAFRRFAELWKQRDWPLAVVVVAFALVLSGLATQPLLALARVFVIAPIAIYDRSILEAAVKHPEDRQPLQTIDSAKTTVRVVNYSLDIPALVERKKYVWVALSEQLQGACHGSYDPVLKLQQILGLPPDPASRAVVTELDVPREALFRPCPGGGELTDSSCGPGFADFKGKTDAERADWMEFLARQMWTSYRSGFRPAAGSPGYPSKDSGYPFTGMGWSYNWGSFLSSHVGVSEFVLMREQPITVVGASKEPAAFCK